MLQAKHSSKIKELFKGYYFSDLFCNQIETFFEYTRLLSHAQYEAISSRLYNKNYLSNFKDNIDIIAYKAQNDLFEYTCRAIKDVSSFCNINKFDFIDFLSKETHNNKRSALYFIVNNNKFIYKPYNADYLVILINIFNMIKPYLRYDSRIFPDILFKTDKYYLTNFIDYELDINSIIIYYNIGVVIAFSFAMRIIDLHSDNIIFGGNNLYIVDSETCFHRNTYELDFTIELTLLINKHRYCGLFDKMKNEFYIHFNDKSEVDYLISRDKKYPNLNIKDHLTFIQQGFKDCYKGIIKNKKQILDIILSKPFSIRHLLRPTNFYTICMIELFKPSLDFNTNKEKLYRGLFKYLKGDINKYNINSIAQAEFNDILNTDIPFFNVYGKDLYYKQTRLFSNFYKEDFSVFIKRWINNLRSNDVEYLNKQIKSIITSQD